MLNQTLNATLSSQTIGFSQWTAVSLSPAFLIASLIVWLFPIVLMLIIGASVRGRSPSGQLYSKPMICFPNFWYFFVVYFFVQSSLFLIGIIFPIWLKMSGAG